MQSLVKSVCLCAVVLSSMPEAFDPYLIVSNTEISWIGYQGSPNPDPNSITITNSGYGTMNWSIVDVNEITFSPPDWLTITPTSGSLNTNESEPVTLRVENKKASTAINKNSCLNHTEHYNIHQWF